MSIFDGIERVGKKDKKYRVFYCFDGKEDYWRVYKLTENFNHLAGQKIFSPQEWQQVLKKGEHVIKDWSEKNLQVASCLVVFIGTQTAQRDIVLFQIEQAWKMGKAVFGIYIHNCDDVKRKAASKGDNPFELVSVDGELLAQKVQVYDPPFREHNEIVTYIQKYIYSWVRIAIADRKSH